MGSGLAASNSDGPSLTSGALSPGEIAIAASVSMVNASIIADQSVGLPGLISASFAFRRRRWWMRLPFLPIPESGYTRWRVHTAYGDRRKRPSWSDIVAFAAWRRSIRRVVEMRSQ